MHIIIGLIVICILIYLLSEYWILLLAAIIVGGLAYYFYHKKSTENARPVPDDERLHLTGKSSSDDPMYPSNYLFEFWPKDVLFCSASRERLGRAKSENLEVKSINNYGVAFVKGSTGSIYKTSLHSCTCKDFENTQKPCKHIFKFALYSNALSPDEELFGIPTDIEERIQSVSQKARHTLIDFCSGDSSEHIRTRSADIDRLLRAGLLIESVNPALVIDKMYSFETIKSILRASSFAELCVKCPRKSDLIQRIINAGEDCINMFTAKYIIVQLDPDLLPFTNSIGDKYSQNS